MSDSDSEFPEEISLNEAKKRQQNLNQNVKIEKNISKKQQNQQKRKQKQKNIYEKIQDQIKSNQPDDSLDLNNLNFKVNNNFKKILDEELPKKKIKILQGKYQVLPKSSSSNIQQIIQQIPVTYQEEQKEVKGIKIIMKKQNAIKKVQELSEKSSALMKLPQERNSNTRQPLGKILSRKRR